MKMEALTCRTMQETSGAEHERLLPEPDAYVKCFYDLFKNIAEAQRLKGEWKKCRKNKTKKKDKKKVDLTGEVTCAVPPEIEVSSNASAFAVFASVRGAVLEKHARSINEAYRASNCSSPPPPEFSDSIIWESDDEDRISPTQNLPKIVGIGLRSVFTLMRESRTVEPCLCTKALGALLDVLQGQLPEGLKSEPDEVIDPLFDLLLDLATSHGPESAAANDGSHLTAVACACLLSLVVVRGDTGRLLATIAALLMSPRALAVQNIQMPIVLNSLQRSVHAILLGKLVRPDWITHGVPKTAKIYTSTLKLPNDINNLVLNGRSFVSDGKYLYLHTNSGLFKIGNGHGGTIWGHVYAHKPDFYPSETGWIGYANSSLYFKCAPKKQCELMILDADTLTIRGIAVLEGKDWSSSLMFSDGENLGMITAGKDDGFVVRTINTLSNPVTVTSELPLKLARKCVDVYGYASFDEDQATYILNPRCDDEIANVAAGKEFMLLKTVSGKLMYTGKGISIGMRNNVRSNRWLEVSVGKTCKVLNFAVGHEGQHVILILEDGSVLFAGTARRGEDGDSNKVRQQPKPSKPKKMQKVEGQFIVNAACNNGSTALVTKEGSLLMFGKDTLYSDETTGLVPDLKDVCVVNVALGKAHTAVLTNKGQLYTFGINNRGQCGRDFSATHAINKEINVTAMETGIAEEDANGTEDDSISKEEQKRVRKIKQIRWKEKKLEEAAEVGEEWVEAKAIRVDGMCPPGQHQWRYRACMVCTVCRECTGYSISCLSSIRPDRNPGQECGCGEGDSGCAECGCCRICARESCDNGGDMPILRPPAACGSSQESELVFREFLRKRFEEKKQKQWKGPTNRGGLPANVAAPQIVVVHKSLAAKAIAGGAVAAVSGAGVAGLAPVEETVGGDGSDVERGDTTRVASIPPARVLFPIDSPVAQVSCGLHHTVALLQSGDVFTFGSNIYGQLGVGNLIAHAGPVQVKIPGTAIQVAAGSNHTVVLTSKGEVYTFGAYQKGQLGMNWGSDQQQQNSTATNSSSSSPSNRDTDRSQPWHCFPNIVPNIGARWGRKATWIGASSDQTYVKVDEINSISLTRSTVMANKNCILLLPHQTEHRNSFKCLVINKHDGTCNSFSGADQVDFNQCAACLDPLYNVIWSFNPTNNEISYYNVISTESRTMQNLEVSILSPGLALPVVPSCYVTRTQAAMHLLACLDTLTQAQDEKFTIVEGSENNQSMHGKVYSREDFATVSRFENHGGGWGYSGQSIEAIRFMADTDILLGGYGLFGGRGEYTAKIKLFDIGLEGGEEETDGELLAETDEIPYECEPRQKYSILFNEPVALQANRWYVAWAKVSGPSSDCGSGGQETVTAEDQVVFYFKTSKEANNGTDVNAGQIPQLLYRVITPENQNYSRKRDQVEPVYILKREFSRTVTEECFHSLISLLQWSWNTLKASLADTSLNTATSPSHIIVEMDRLVYISKASLRLLRTYTNEIYPNQASKKTPSESVRLAECIGEVRALLRQILSDSVSTTLKTKGKTRFNKNSTVLSNKMTGAILDECYKTFVACYHAFYPTAYLKWTSLCELLSEIDKEQGITSKDRLLSAVLASLCSSSVRLRCTFPILNNVMDCSDSVKRQLSPSDNAGLPMMNSTEAHHYPILVEQISYKSQVESTGKEILNWSFREVLDRLLDLILIPVKRSLCREKSQSLPHLVLHCCYLLARVISELAAYSNGNGDEMQAACYRLMYTTPSRFTRVNQTRSWNTGNGSPDAICFSVDRPGILIAGVAIYGGVGVYYYELELLDDRNNTGNDPSHTQHWSSLDFTRGSFGPDDCINDVVELKFDKPIPIKEKVKYAIRLRNRGGRTSNGDAGLRVVKGPDGTSFTFSACSLSFNGTTQARGQIPHILYYSNPQDSNEQHTSKAIAEVQARKCTLAMTATIIQRANDILALAREKADDIDINEILGNAAFVTTLLPLTTAYIIPLATSDPRSGVQVLTLIQEMLPHVTALNLTSAMKSSQVSLQQQDNDATTQQMAVAHYIPPVTTTSHYCTWLESDHPYKPATVSYYRVTFPETVKWLTLEFTPDCGTAQPEDYLQLYIPNVDGSFAKSPESCNLEESPVYWPVLHKLSNVQSQWPQNAVVLPGNEVIFSLETASDYMKDERSITYGFKCLVIGYDWISTSSGLKNLEIELSFLGGACAASLMKKNLSLPLVSTEEAEEDSEQAQATAKRIFSVHSTLLGRGFALAAPPTVGQALDGVLPFSCHSNERLFLRDFVSCTSGTSGGRLARWLQPDSFIDPSKCEIVYASEEMRYGWPAVVTLVTRDQYGEIVHVPGLKIEAKAVPIDKRDLSEPDQGKKIRRISQPDPMTFGGHPQPSLDAPYEVTVLDDPYKVSFHAITIMKAYRNYSFEELRFTSSALKRSSESMMVMPTGDGTYKATWTPFSVGWYSIRINIDGYDMEDNYKVEVKRPPQGMELPALNIVKKPQHLPSRVRRFVAKNSAGLRIRAHPSLQSKQIGVVPVDSTIVYCDEIHNDDGIWLRLNVDTIAKYCNSGHLEAWCLQYNQHLGKTLLLPVEEPKTTAYRNSKETLEHKKSGLSEDKRKTVTLDSGKTMAVITCGASGHNIRNRPSLKAAVVGKLALGNTVTVQENFVNRYGTWVRISSDSASKYCFENDGEAWSLAINKHGVAYMKITQDTDEDIANKKQVLADLTPTNQYQTPNHKGYDKSPSMPSGSQENDQHNAQQQARSLQNCIPPGSAGSGEGLNSSFLFGTYSTGIKQQQHDSLGGSDKGTTTATAASTTDKTTEPSSKLPKNHLKERPTKEREREGGGGGGGGGKFSVLQKWLRGDDKAHGEKRSSPGRDFSEFVGVSVKELVKAMGESRANGNGSTPPETPRRMSRSSSPKNPQAGSPRLASRSSSPVPIPGGKNLTGGGDSASSSPLLFGSPRSVGISPLVSGGMVDSGASHRRGSTQSDTSALVSSLTRDPSQSPSGVSSIANTTRDLSPSPSCSSLHMRSEGSTSSPPETPKKEQSISCDSQDASKKVSEAQTQTSPESATTAMKGHFSINSTNAKDDRHVSKTYRRDHSKAVKTRAKRAMSPANSQQTPSPSRTLNLNKEKVKEAISPSVAECLRAVFAAFLWHEGIVHDAMACASFLKFHPGLPKQGALVVTRQTALANNEGRKNKMTREERARQRHSVEVTNDGNYLHIQPSTLESLTRSAANANANRNRKKQEPTTGIKEETPPAENTLTALPEFTTVTVLPPALKSLVFLWEELSMNCLQAIDQQTVLPSPMAQPPVIKLSKRSANDLSSKIPTSTPVKDSNGVVVEKREKRGAKDRKEWKPITKVPIVDGLGGIERETTCELCGLMFPPPVTYHMKLMHPGCGWHAGGNGYNSGGNYCVGWAGNCGDGGGGGSSWYLLCDTCRDKYLKAKKNKRQRRMGETNKLMSPLASPENDDTHIIVKNNAMFLLDLASAAGVNIPKQQRRPSQTLSSVAENYSPPEAAGPFPSTGPFQCLLALGVQSSQNNEEKFYEEILKRQGGQQTSFDAGSGSGLTVSNRRPLSECPMSDSDSDSGKNRGMFHRSVSMSTGAPWAKNSSDGRVVIMRKRNNSSSELTNDFSDAGSSLLCYPSAALQKLVPSMDQSAIVSSNQAAEIANNDRIDLLMRPVMLFVLQQHNLQHLQYAMKQALRRAACRVYAMQALNWLLRSVTQPICLHDLLWWFVASLTPIVSDSMDINEDDNRKRCTERKKDHDMVGVCEHPLSDLVIAGEAANPLPTAFHTLLQTIADLMLLPPPGSPLQRAAVRCWAIQFTPADHMFLHRSHVFSNISKILSRSEEEEDATMSMHKSHQSNLSGQVPSSVESLKDLTSGVEIKTSSRQAMISSLTDSSTETFWESGDEDRDKTKTITIICGAHSFPRMVYIHVDNCRDLTHKVSCVTFQSGIDTDEMIKLKTVEIESRSTGWVKCPIINPRHVVVGLELKGPDNSLRVRQIRVLGEIEGESLKIGKQLNAISIQQKNCESETLKVFRSITSQVFGKLIQGEQPNSGPISSIVVEPNNEELEESNELREHMVGILFSRSKLTNLQKQVCTHIVQAIRKETVRLREEWETLLCSPTPVNSFISDNSDMPKAADTYCFEMLSMVLALSGSSVGRNYLSHQCGLLKDLLSLLHTGSARVQRQVTSLLRRILPEIKPEALANVVGADRLPPSDFSIISAASNGYSQSMEFDEHSLGILDVFLSCIAKALTVQVKVKDKESNGKALQSISLATSIHPKSFVGVRWWLRGCITRKLAEEIIQLLKDMASGKLSDAWAAVTKAAIAENILNLTRMDDKNRDPTKCLRSPTLWLALSSLCVLDSDHVERLSSGQWSSADGQPPPPRPTCSNHDDGETTAIIQCNNCGNLCADCDRVLHLHRRTRMHVRQVCKEEEEAIRVDLHEGCGRMKLFWILVLADSQTLKALVEFRDGPPQKPVGATSGVCRFCGTTGNTGLLAIGNICSDHECQEHAKNACSKVHSCGHICGGVRDERPCLPCLHRCNPTCDLKQDADDMCMICFTEALSCAPAIQLQCGHVFHLHCCRTVLLKRWHGPRITFSFSLCPICKIPMENHNLAEQLASVKALYEDVKRKALMRLEYEGLHKADAVTTPGGRYYQDPAAYAMDRYAYYVCYKCQKAYYGGEARCDAQQGGESFDPTELVCGGCSDVARAQMCPKHGTDFLEYKCRFCCSVAVFFCFGTTHFCKPCHDDFQRVTNIPKSELPSCPAGPKAKQMEGDECPLHVKHPPTGEEFALGCGICRNAQTF
ncbi:E3 ubiquitin-protein ligase MYCBP2 isoform X6 [Nasonia vitripennis]|uniref:RCR-type E3 ubiquitin transferase n=1 Tax=Nasonia vitripennis TaxID=7425 RepID=A0A7M7Q516_NASVI|nr:E3 ubiquitin-protein ligase MYCBP2 isoform X6 [Nasonia vitripennis]